MPTDYTLSNTLPLALREGMRAYQETKAEIAARKAAEAAKIEAAKRQSMMDQRYNDEQATSASQFDREMRLKERMAGSAAQDRQAKTVKGRPLSVNTAEELGDRLAIPGELQRNAADVKAQPDLLGPENKLLTRIPWAFSQRKDVASKVGSIRKLAARAIEGARLTDSDMEYYTKNLPSETDTPQEFENKTRNLVGLLSRATTSRMGSLGKAGYDISGYESDLANLAEMGKQTGETGVGADPRLEMAKQALNDPEATPEEKAQAKKLLGM